LCALPRDASDHCPLVLKGESSDWGPKPFRFNNHWLENQKFKGMVERVWRNYGVGGWMGFVLKSKLKALEGEIREWNKVEYGNVEMRLNLLRQEIEELDGFSDSRFLTNDEGVIRKHKFEELWKLWKSKESILFQRSRSKWLREGGC